MFRKAACGIPLHTGQSTLTCPFLHGFSAFLKIHGSLETPCFQAIQKPGIRFVSRAGSYLSMFFFVIWIFSYQCSTYYCNLRLFFHAKKQKLFRSCQAFVSFISVHTLLESKSSSDFFRGCGITTAALSKMLVRLMPSASLRCCTVRRFSFRLQSCRRGV